MQQDLVIQQVEERSTGGESNKLLNKIETNKATKETEDKQSEDTDSIMEDATYNTRSMSSTTSNKKKLPQSSTSLSIRSKKARTNGNFRASIEERNQQATMTGTKYTNSQTPSEIRIRFQYKINNLQGKTFGDQMKHILHDIMLCIKEIDTKARLMTWCIKDTESDLDGKELLLISSKSVTKYIDSPTSFEEHPPIVAGRTYYQQGIRVATKVPVYEFTEAWNNMKYTHKNIHPCLTVISMRKAEMQRSEVAFPVGYFSGTTERGEYSTVSNALESTIEGVEVSYQMIRQQGISQEIWHQARLTAEGLGK